MIEHIVIPPDHYPLKIGELIQPGDLMYSAQYDKFLPFADTGAKWSKVTEFDIIIRKVDNAGN